MMTHLLKLNQMSVEHIFVNVSLVCRLVKSSSVGTIKSIYRIIIVERNQFIVVCRIEIHLYFIIWLILICIKIRHTFLPMIWFILIFCKKFISFVYIVINSFKSTVLRWNHNSYFTLNRTVDIFIITWSYG